MYILLIIFHVIICLGLIATILLQAGRGGGLAEAFGGGESAQSLLGTQAPEVLKKATEIAAILFLVTSLTLGMITARRGRSLFETGRVPALPVSPETPIAAPKDIPEAPAEAETPAETVSPAEAVEQTEQAPSGAQ
ncbi:MAG: preprotein translocase subunit SecG [Candidatus Omnitrophica bacterium]|nr:preprotein translocase subunit SecG [Candidatus Omnitrophota bacterium]